MNYFNLLYGNFSFVQSELASLGVLHLREGAHLQGSGYNAQLYGEWLALGKENGIDFDAVIDPRSSLGTLNTGLLNQIQALAGPTLALVEGANELDVSGLPGWAQLDQSYQTTLFDSEQDSNAGSSIGVIGPAMAFVANGAQVGDLSNEMNYGNLHPYPGGQVPSVVFPQQTDLEQVVSGTKPIMFTETGYHNAVNEQNDQPGVSEAAAAKYVPRLFLEDFMHGIVRTYLYELIDEGSDPGLTNPQLNWGLIRADGSEKPAFTSLKNLIGEVTDTADPATLTPLSWELSPNSTQIHHLLLQKSSGVYDLVLWQEVPSYDITNHIDISNPDVTAQLTLGNQAASITVYQPMTQATPLQTYSNVNTVSLAIPDHPLVVEISF